MPRITTFDDADGEEKIQSIVVSGDYLNMYRVAGLMIEKAGRLGKKPFFQFELEGRVSPIFSVDTALAKASLVARPQQGRYDNWD